MNVPAGHPIRVIAVKLPEKPAETSGFARKISQASLRWREYNKLRIGKSNSFQPKYNAFTMVYPGKL